MSLVKGAVKPTFCFVYYKHGNMPYLIFNICHFVTVTKVVFAYADHVKKHLLHGILICDCNLRYKCFSLNNQLILFETTYFSQDWPKTRQIQK